MHRVLCRAASRARERIAAPGIASCNPEAWSFLHFARGCGGGASVAFRHDLCTKCRRGLLPWRPVRWDDAAASGPRAQLPCRRDLAAWRDALNDETNTGQRAFRVLVVDDERNIRKTLAVCLESLGCAVTECGTAAAPIHSLARLPHDLAFVDLRLGKESGPDLLRSLLAERPALQGILITASPTTDTPGDALPPRPP